MHFLEWNVWNSSNISLRFVPMGPIDNFIINTLTQNGRHFSDDLIKCIFLNENVWNSSNISLKFAPMGPIDNISEFGQTMAWWRPGHQLLYESMMVRLPTHICITRPQRVNLCVSLTGLLNPSISQMLQAYHWNHWNDAGHVVHDSSW